jgi:hypothetical protein
VRVSARVSVVHPIANQLSLPLVSAYSRKRRGLENVMGSGEAASAPGDTGSDRLVQAGRTMLAVKRKMRVWRSDLTMGLHPRKRNG